MYTFASRIAQKYYHLLMIHVTLIIKGILITLTFLAVMTDNFYMYQGRAIIGFPIIAPLPPQARKGVLILLPFPTSRLRGGTQKELYPRPPTYFIIRLPRKLNLR